MNKKAVLLWIIALLMLVACGGGGEPEADAPASTNDTSSSTAAEEEAEEEDSTSSDSEEMEEAPADTAEEAEEAPADEEEADEPEEETAVEEAPVEEASGGFGDRPMTGTDPETGLAINPDSVNPGDTFIVRGEIISMNLTPTTSPEFLIQSPDGLKFRLRSQDLAETFFEDGDQLQPFQYQLGILAQATATLAADASPSDIPTSDDLVLVKDE